MTGGGSRCGELGVGQGLNAALDRNYCITMEM